MARVGRIKPDHQTAKIGSFKPQWYLAAQDTLLLVATLASDDEHVPVSRRLGIKQELAQGAVRLHLGAPMQVDTCIDRITPSRELLSGFAIDGSQRRRWRI
jgi:hypothetical protein